MPRTWVKVEGPEKRDVFVNQVAEPSGRTLVPFRVEVGQSTFFLLHPSGDIEAERTQDCPPAPKDDPVIVPLAPMAVAARVRALAPTAKTKPKRRAPARPKAKRRTAGRKP